MSIKIKNRYIPVLGSKIKRPLFLSPVPAGFPSPAEDYVEKRLDISKYLIKNRTSTFYLKVQGNSMIGASINSGDLLVVDRSERPRNGQVVVAVLNGEFTVKRLQQKANRPLLLPENPKYKAIQLSDGDEMKIWGVVKHVIHSF
jgi:DNA polymerase V